MSQHTIVELIQIFNLTVNQQIAFIEKKTRLETDIANMSRVKKRISALKQTMGDHILIQESITLFMKYKQQIIDKNEQFFLSKDPRAEGLKLKANEDYIYDLIESLKKQYIICSLAEKAKIWADVKTLFEASCSYYIQTNP